MEQEYNYYCLYLDSVGDKPIEIVGVGVCGDIFTQVSQSMADFKKTWKMARCTKETFDYVSAHDDVFIKNTVKFVYDEDKIKLIWKPSLLRSAASCLAAMLQDGSSLLHIKISDGHLLIDYKDFSGVNRRCVVAPSGNVRYFREERGNTHWKEYLWENYT